MPTSMWFIVGSILATIAGVVVQKLIEGITGQQTKAALDKERKKLEDEYASIRIQLQEKTEELEGKVLKLQEENLSLMKESMRLELEQEYCSKQLAWLRQCNPTLFENCPFLSEENA